MTRSRLSMLFVISCLALTALQPLAAQNTNAPRQQRPSKPRPPRSPKYHAQVITEVPLRPAEDTDQLIENITLKTLGTGERIVSTKFQGRPMVRRFNRKTRQFDQEVQSTKYYLAVNPDEQTYRIFVVDDNDPTEEKVWARMKAWQKIKYGIDADAAMKARIRRTSNIPSRPFVPPPPQIKQRKPMSAGTLQRASNLSRVSGGIRLASMQNFSSNSFDEFGEPLRELEEQGPFNNSDQHCWAMSGWTSTSLDAVGFALAVADSGAAAEEDVFREQGVHRRDTWGYAYNTHYGISPTNWIIPTSWYYDNDQSTEKKLYDGDYFAEAEQSSFFWNVDFALWFNLMFPFFDPLPVLKTELYNYIYTAADMAFLGAPQHHIETGLSGYYWMLWVRIEGYQYTGCEYTEW